MDNTSPWVAERDATIKLLTMKKAFHILVSLSTTLTLLQGMAAFGQTPSPSPSPSPRPAVTRSPGVIRERLQQQRQEVRARFSEVRKARIRAFWERMAKRLEAAIEREKKLADRIESRLNKFQEAGKDVSASRAKLGQARAKINQAEAALNAAKGTVEAVLNADDPKAAFQEVRDTVLKDVIAKIKEAHAALVDVINTLKGVSGKVKPTPSPTVSPTASPTPTPTASPSPSPSPTP